MYRLILVLAVATIAGAVACQPFTISGNPVAGLPDVDAKVWDVLEHNGKLYIAGEFTLVGGTARANLAEIDLATGQVTTWNPNPDNFCAALAVHNNVLYVGGGFTQITGQARNSLASFDLSTHALTGWNPACSLPPNTTNIFFDDDVHCLHLVGDTLYAGGGFTAIDGTPRGHACSFDLNNLPSSNGLTAWDPNILGSVTYGSPSFGAGGVQRIWVDAANDRCILTGGILEAGGAHWHDGSSSGHTSVYGYAIVANASGAGAPRPEWVPTFGTGSAVGNTLIVNTCFGIGSQAYISGMFTTITSGGANNNRLIAAGLSLTANTATQNCVTMFDPNPDLRVWAMESDSAGDVLFAGGEFTIIGGAAAPRLAMLDPTTGAAIGAWSPAPNDTVRALHFAGSRLYVAGEFTLIGGAVRQRLAAFDVTYPSNTPPAITVTSNGSPVASGATLSVPFASALSSLGLQINVADADGDTVALVGAITNVGSTGILAGEFNHSAGAPYALYPSAGVFDAQNVAHVVTLDANDGRGGTGTFTFSISVGSAPGGGNPPQAGGSRSNSSQNACAVDTGGEPVAGLLMALLAVLAIRLPRRHRKRASCGPSRG